MRKRSIKSTAGERLEIAMGNGVLIVRIVDGAYASRGTLLLTAGIRKLMRELQLAYGRPPP